MSCPATWPHSLSGTRLRGPSPASRSCGRCQRRPVNAVPAGGCASPSVTKSLGPGAHPCVAAKPWVGTGSSDSSAARPCLAQRQPPRWRSCPCSEGPLARSSGLSPARTGTCPLQPLFRPRAAPPPESPAVSASVGLGLRSGSGRAGAAGSSHRSRGCSVLRRLSHPHALNSEGTVSVPNPKTKRRGRHGRTVETLPI